MSLHSGVDERKYLNGELALYFKSIQLTQRGTTTPIVFRGPGRVYLEDSQLRYEIYHVAISDEFSRHSMHSLTGRAGELMGESSVYDFSGTDIRGRLWESSSADTSSGDYSAEYSIVQGRIETLAFTKEIPNQATASVLLKFFDSDHFPSPRSPVRPDLAFSVDGTEVLLKRNEASCDLFLRDGPITKKYVDSCHKALNVISGVMLEPAFGQFVIGTEVREEFYSRYRNVNVERLFPPVEIRFGDESALLAEIFKPLRVFFSNDGAQLYDAWYKVNRSLQTGIQTMSLHVAVAVEGVLKDYFVKYGKDSEFFTIADEAWPLIEGLRLNERMLEYLRSSFAGIKNFKPKTALYKLTEEGRLSEGLTSAWNRLRSETAHAVGSGVTGKELQRLVDLTLSTMKLFYELMFIAAGYQGSRIDYEIKGFPSNAVPKQLAAVALTGVKWTFCGHSAKVWNKNGLK